MVEYDWSKMHKDAVTTLSGDFPVVIISAVAGVSTKDQPQVKFKAKVESGPYAGRALSGQFTLVPDSQGALRMFFIHMDILGFNSAFFDQLPKDERGMEILARELVNRRAIATVGSRMWQGTERESIEGWKPSLVPNAAPSVGVLGGLGAPAADTLGGVISNPSTPGSGVPAAVQQELGAQPSAAAPEPPF